MGERCFNGAVDSHRRRHAVVVLDRSTDGELQWGRRLASTETTTPDYGDCMTNTNASMGPSTRIDGDKWDDVPEGPLKLASMGPSTRIDGDVHLRAALARGQGASMGPSTRIDGDDPSSGLRTSGRIRFNGAVDSHRRRPP